MAVKYTIKQILLSNNNWWNFYKKYGDKLRIAIVISITKLLSCKNIIRGYHEYHCSNPKCSHVKRVLHTCKSKACSSCGIKATKLWIEKQNNILPKTAYQHITFTMPRELWDFFWLNRFLFNKVSLIAADCIKSIANKKNVIPGIFTALHTFGRDLKRNVHIHLSTTLGGISKNGSQWKKLFFHQPTLRNTWRYAIIKLFRQSELMIPQAIRKQLNSTFTFNHFLDQLYKKTWVVHCSKPSDNHKHNVEYLAGYVKRPPIAESKLKHYDGHDVTLRYLDHTTNTYKNRILSAEEFIGKFVQHIPDVGFRMIRYYGFLAHRVRGQLLPLVHQLLGQVLKSSSTPPTHAQLIQKNFNFNPLMCILCGSPLLLALVHFGSANLPTLLSKHQELALLQKL
jgi:Putative transposase/Transposase zinc-binding domain